MKSVFQFEDMAISDAAPKDVADRAELDLPIVVPVGSRIKRKGSVYVVYACDFEFVGNELVASYQAHLVPSE